MFGLCNILCLERDIGVFFYLATERPCLHEVVTYTPSGMTLKNPALFTEIPGCEGVGEMRNGVRVYQIVIM